MSWGLWLPASSELDRPGIRSHYTGMQQSSLSPPQSEAELLQRCHDIAGKSLQQLADLLAVPVPENLRRHKGWVGQLVELALGADAQSLAEPDFRAIGVEIGRAHV